MTDYIENYYYSEDLLPLGGESFNRAQRKAVASVLPFIMKQELTQRQYICMKYRYESGKSQAEIADLLHLTQPTVSRHIQTAKQVLNQRLKYCTAAVTAALCEYDKDGSLRGY